MAAKKTKTMPQPKCDLCHDVETGKPEEMFLHARCHMTAPLQVSYKDGVLTLRCYIPECRRLVGEFKVSERLK